MRTFKFRAWDNNGKVMWNHEMIDESDAAGAVFWGEIFNGKSGFTVMQFTGLKDANGVEIYDGDIISIYDTYNQVWSKDGAVVVFSNDYVGGWVVSNGNQNLNLGTRQNLLKIIGNIHENKGLLEG